MFSQFACGLKRYWFVALPAIMLNVGITLDHVIARNNENVIRVRVKELALEAWEATNLQDDAPLSETLQAHWITANQDGNLEGRISAIEPSPSSTVPIEKLDVALLKKGEKISKATTDNDGKFTLKNVEPGVYTLIAAGQNGFLAYGVHVLPKIQAFDALEKNSDVDSKILKQAYYVSHFNVPQDSVVVDNLQIDAAAVPPEFSTLQRISQNYLPSAAALSTARDQDDAKAIGKATKIRSGFKHPLSADGSFEGRIQPIASNGGKAAKLSEMNIFLIQDDIEAARVNVEENGKFKVEDVDPGVYSLVAAGKDGFAALSVELEAADQSTTSTTEKAKAHYVSTHAPVSTVVESLGIAIVTDPDDVQTIKQEIDRIFKERQQNKFIMQGDQGQFPPGDIAQFPPGVPGGISGGSGFPSGGGGSGPVYGGFGGGGSGGGVFTGNRGGLGGLIALSLGITALATNDSGENPPSMSPVFPEPPPSSSNPPIENLPPAGPPADNPLDPTQNVN